MVIHLDEEEEEMREKSRLTNLRFVPLIEIDLVSNTVDHNVPRVHGAGGGHQQGQNGIGGKNVSSVIFCQLLDDGIVAGGDLGMNGRHALEGALVLGGDAIIGFVIEAEGSAKFAVKEKKKKKKCWRRRAKHTDQVIMGNTCQRQWGSRSSFWRGG